MEASIFMRNRLLVAALALTAASAATADVAGPNIKPGLWEMNVEGGNGPGMPNAGDMQKAMQKMQAQLAKMPPEQRKMMEQQMGNLGLSVTGGGGIRICMTDEDIKRQDIPLNDGKCDTTIKTRTASRWAASMVCTEPKMKGDVEAVFESPTAYSVKMKGTVTQDGREQPYAMSMRWKYITSDCGTVKSPSAIRAAAGLKKK